MEKSKIVLSTEQMAELTAMGMDCSDASLCWVALLSDKNYRIETRERGSYLLNSNLVWRYQYAYTLEDILNKLPYNIITNNNWYELYISKYGIRYDDIHTGDAAKEYNDIYMLDNAFNMLKWVYNNFPNEIKCFD